MLNGWNTCKCILNLIHRRKSLVEGPMKSVYSKVFNASESSQIGSFLPHWIRNTLIKHPIISLVSYTKTLAMAGQSTKMSCGSTSECYTVPVVTNANLSVVWLVFLWFSVDSFNVQTTGLFYTQNMSLYLKCGVNEASESAMQKMLSYIVTSYLSYHPNSSMSSTAFVSTSFCVNFTKFHVVQTHWC